MGTANKEDGAILCLMPTLDRVYNEYLEKGKSGNTRSLLPFGLMVFNSGNFNKH